MNIAFISQPFEYVEPDVQAGSIAIWTDRVIQSLNDADHRFRVYAKRFPNQEAVTRKDEIEYYRVETGFDERFARVMRLGERLAGHPRPKLPFFATDWNYRRYIHQIAADLRARPVDIVHIHNYSQFIPFVRAAAPQSRIVMHMSCDWLGQIDARVIKQRLQEADLVLGCSDHVSNLVRQGFPQFADSCKTVFNGVDLQRFSRNDSSPKPAQDRVKHLLFVGRISPEKGTHILLKAFERVARQRADVQLDIVGPGGSAPYEYMVLISDDPRVQNLAVRYQGRLHHSDYFEALNRSIPPEIADRVNFAGSVPHDRVVEYYRRASILINPSLTEAFGMSLVEGMANRLPVVATRIGGMPEIVKHGETGLLVEPDDPQELAAALLRLLDDDDLRRRMGQAGYQYVPQMFTWEKVTSTLDGYYRQLAALD